MNRREFLFNAAAGLFVAASPKIIFDMGRGLYLPKLKFYEQSFDMGDRWGMVVEMEIDGVPYRHAVRYDGNPRDYGAMSVKSVSPEKKMLCRRVLIDWAHDKQRRILRPGEI